MNITLCSSFSPRKDCNKILRAENLIHDQAQVGDLVVVDADEDDAVVAQERARQEQAGVDHVQPVRVEAPAGARVGRERAQRLVHLPGAAQVVLGGLAEVVAVDEVVAGVVGRVDVDHLDTPGVGLLEELERVQIVRLDEEVARRVLVHARARHGDERPARRFAGAAARRPLAWPEEAEVFGVRAFFLKVVAQRGAQRLPVDRPVGKSLRRDGAQLREAVGVESEGRSQALVGHLSVTLPAVHPDKRLQVMRSSWLPPSLPAQVDRPLLRSSSD